MPHKHPFQPNEDVVSYRNTPNYPTKNNPWNSTSPRSLRRPKPQVVDWIKASPFHVPCVHYCFDKSTPTVLRPNRPCFPLPLQGCTRPKPHVPTPFDPLFSSTGGGNSTPSEFRHTLVKRGTTAPKHVPLLCVSVQTLSDCLYRYNGTHTIHSSIVLFV